MSISNATPVLAVDEKNLIPVSDHLRQMADIPPSRMFLINKSLKVYVEKNPGAKIFDASQGDGGASLPGTPRAILERASQLQIEHGTAYSAPKHIAKPWLSNIGNWILHLAGDLPTCSVPQVDVTRWSKPIKPCSRWDMDDKAT